MKVRIMLAAAPPARRLRAGRYRGEWLSRKPRVCGRTSPAQGAAGHGRHLQAFELPAKCRRRPLVGFFRARPSAIWSRMRRRPSCSAGHVLGPAPADRGRRPGQGLAVLNAAYNDAAGVTAEFNLNLLARINRELAGNFELESFEHHAFFNRRRQPHRDAPCQRQAAEGEGRRRDLEFRAGETIHTENSYKYSVDSLPALARGVGWQPAGVWADARDYFSIQAFRLGE